MSWLSMSERLRVTTCGLWPQCSVPAPVAAADSSMVTGPGWAISALIWSDRDLGGLDGTTPTADHRRHLGISPRPRVRGAGRPDLGGRCWSRRGVLGRRAHAVPARRARLPGDR